MRESGSRGNRRLRRSAAPTIAVLASILLAPLALSAEPNDDPPPGPGAAALNDPLIREQVAAEQRASREEAERRRQPEEIEARESSRTQYENLTGQEAAQLAEATFPQLLGQPSWEPLDEARLGEVIRYYGTHSALVEPQGAELTADSPPTDADGVPDETDSGALLESTLPLRAETESGALQPVDPALVDRGPYLEPANAAVEAKLPDDLSRGVSVPELDLELAPAGAEQAASARLVGPDKRLFANSALDTDFLAASTPTGLQAFLMLRSQRSPERHSLELELPAGAELAPAFRGLGAVIERDGRPLVTVTPPLAFDADGTYVPVELGVEESKLVLSIEHRSADLKYPILVDPAVTEPFDFNRSGQCADLSFWEWNSSWTNKFFPGCSYALATQANGGNYYGHTESARWLWRAPSGTFIEWAEFSGSDFAHSDGGSTATCASRGIYDPTRRVWQSGFGADHTGFVSGPTTNCSPYANSTWSQSVGYQKDLTTDPTDPQGAIGNMAVFELFMYGNGYRWQNAWTLWRGAQFHLYDRDDPYFTSAPPASSSSFVDDSRARTHYRTLSANDGGVGVNQLHLYTSRGTPDGAFDVRYFNRGCSGLRPNGGCRGTWPAPVSYTLPEGLNSIHAYALDQLGKVSSRQEWKQAIDRSAPVVGAPSGTLYTNRSDIVSELGYTLNLSATDGSLSSDSAKRSGAEQLDVKVDGVTRYSLRRECTSTNGSCALNSSIDPRATWRIPEGFFEPGTHTIEIVATDGLGHRSPAGSRVFTINVRSDELEPEVTITAGESALDGSYALRVVATDGQPIGGAAGTVQSGVRDLEVYADGQLLETIHQDCPQGGCSFSRTYRMSALQSPTLSEFSATADDGAGNGSTQPYGRKRSRYNYFGFNENGSVLRERFDLVTLAGASILRFPVGWCGAAQSSSAGDSEPPTPESTWETRLRADHGALFEAVADWNGDPNHADELIYMLPVALDSPAWANSASDSVDPCDGVNVPPDPEFEDEWADFVRMIADEWGAQRYGLIAIEAWNEPNLRPFWGVRATNDDGSQIDPPPAFDPEPHRFASLVNAANDAIEAWNATPTNTLARGALPAIKVLPGGLSPEGGAGEDEDPVEPAQPADPEETPAIFLDAALDGSNGQDHLVFGESGLGTVDGLAVHLYASLRRQDKGARMATRDQYNALVAVLEQNGFVDTPRWITEIGFPSEPLGNRDVPRKAASPARQCRRLTTAYLRFARQEEQPRSFIVHRLFDPPSAEEENRFGLARTDPADPTQVLRKQSYRELKQLAEPSGTHQRIRCQTA